MIGSILPGLFLLSAVSQAGAFTLEMRETAAGEQMVYYTVDTGDGRTVVTAPGLSQYPARLEIDYTEGGAYDLRWRATDLSGQSYPWHTLKRKQIEATRSVIGPPLPVNIKPTIDSPSTWEVELPGHRRLDSIEMDFTDEAGGPHHFDLQLSVDGGAHWLPVPSASLRHFSPLPGSVLQLPLHGLVANRLRIRFYFAEASEPLRQVHLYGDSLPLFSTEGEKPSRMAAWNNLYANFGPARTEVHDRFLRWWPTARPFSGGMAILPNTEWAEWNALQLSWTDDPLLDLYERNLKIMPQSETGYVWVAPNEEKHLNHSRHPVATAVYISGVVRHFLQRGDRDFLFRPHTEGHPNLYHKIERGYHYLMGVLGARSGLATITDPELSGTPQSQGANYWDAWKFGYRSAYLNLYIYRALADMTELYRFLGDEEKAAQMAQESETVKAAFTEKFWDEEKGRFIGWYDVDGQAYDFGFTFLNQIAVASSIASETQKRRIMDWLLGHRLIEGDRSQGKDIYHFKIVSRSNTVPAESMQPPPWGDFYGGFLVAAKDRAAEFGLTIQNGGGIFYTTYYDLHARLRTDGADSAYALFKTVADEAARNALRLMPDTRFTIVYPLGIVREFSESGIVPVFFLDGFMGLRVTGDGLCIRPRLPSDWSQARVSRYYYQGRFWDITVSHEIEQPTVGKSGNDVTPVQVPAQGSYLLTHEGTLKSETVSTTE